MSLPLGVGGRRTANKGEGPSLQVQLIDTDKIKKFCRAHFQRSCPTMLLSPF